MSVRNTSTSFSYINATKLNSLSGSIDTVCYMVPNISGNIIKKTSYLQTIHVYSPFNLIKNNYIEKNLYFILN
ncbi:hypothetical protein [Buchnera aphidicola]|uniref:hypothetical protein n=1 Tax=Buchnera aphidicola TaxID=9 RepID=UPI0012ABD086|nr:hypothetical protein [Buchnera aphidicola]